MNCKKKSGESGLSFRITTSREQISRAIFIGGARHFTANDIFHEVNSGNEGISLSTVYNTLAWLVQTRQLRQLPQFCSTKYYDTVFHGHVHMYEEQSGELIDAPSDLSAAISMNIFDAFGRNVDSEVIIHTRNKPSSVCASANDES